MVRSGENWNGGGERGKGEMSCVQNPGWLFIYIYIPRTQLTSIIFEGQPSKTRPFSIKTRVIWVPGIYIEDYTIHLYGDCNKLIFSDPFLNQSLFMSFLGFEGSNGLKNRLIFLQPGGDFFRDVIFLKR